MTAYDVGAYADVPDFIYGITREIWEDRGIGAELDRIYHPDILLRAATGVTTSNKGVTAQTLQTLHQFPDRQLVGEDVIGAGYEDGSFLSSHRLTSVMRHQGSGAHGRATDRVVRSRIIAPRSPTRPSGSRAPRSTAIRASRCGSRCAGRSRARTGASGISGRRRARPST